MVQNKVIAIGVEWTFPSVLNYLCALHIPEGLLTTHVPLVLLWVGDKAACPWALVTDNGVAEMRAEGIHALSAHRNEGWSNVLYNV